MLIFGGHDVDVAQLITASCIAYHLWTWVLSFFNLAWWLHTEFTVDWVRAPLNGECSHVYVAFMSAISKCIQKLINIFEMQPISGFSNSNIAQDQRIIDPKRGPIRRTAAVKTLPRLEWRLDEIDPRGNCFLTFRPTADHLLCQILIYRVLPLHAVIVDAFVVFSFSSLLA
jgi:hypothetical protein